MGPCPVTMLRGVGDTRQHVTHDRDPREPGYEAELRAPLDRLTEEIRPHARAEAWKAYQRAPHALELEELHSAALSGLAHARARWVRYCLAAGHDPRALHYFGAYAMRRMRGAILDAMRANDWVTRSARARAKALRDAGQDQGLTEAQLSAATGLTAREVRGTVAAVAARPVSLDAEPHDVADPGDTEGQAIVSAVLDAALRAMHALPPAARDIIALHYYEGLPLPAAAAVLGVPEGEARAAHEQAALAVRDAMVREVA